MTLFSGVFASSIQNPAVPLTSTTLLDYLGITRNASGVNVTEEKALGMPSVWRATTLIAGVAASLPFHAYKADGTTRAPVSGHAATLLADPHPDMTPFELWETAYAHMLLWGNAYFRKLRNPLGQTVELWPVHPSRVAVGRDRTSGRKIYRVDGDDYGHTDDTILHLPGFGYDGVCGVSPVRAARQGVGLALAAEEYGAKLFGSGSLATGILQTEQRLTEDQATALSARWKAKRSGLNSAHETLILDSGAKFEQLSIPPEDAQFLESRRFQVSEVCRMFGLPPFLMFETEKSTSWGTGLEQQALGWVVYDLRRFLMRVEQRVSKHLLRPATVYARYSVEGLLRGDSAARAKFYRAMWEIGALNTDEIRELEERDKVPGGDARHRPLNMGQLGTFDTESTGDGNPTGGMTEDDEEVPANAGS